MRKAGEFHSNEDLELLKAVAQAWHAHAGEANPTNEFGFRRAAGPPLLRAAGPPLCRPSRFKLEAAAAKAGSSWDFGRSLWDSYEIVAVAKQLEACNLALDKPMPPPDGGGGGGGPRQGKRRWESKNSLRSLFGKASSRR